MRLIDADVENEKLLDFIAQHDSGIQYALEHKDMTILEDIFFEFFKEQPTAFNSESVIAELEEKILKFKESLMSCIDEDYAVKLRVKMSVYEEIKEILNSAANATNGKTGR